MYVFLCVPANMASIPKSTPHFHEGTFCRVRDKEAGNALLRSLWVSPSASRNALRMVSIPQRLQRELSVPHFKSLSFSIKDFAILTMFDCAFCATQIAEQPFRSFVVPSCRCSCGGTSSFSRYLGAIGVQERATGLVERISSRSVRRRGVMQRYSSFLGTQSDCSQPFY